MNESGQQPARASILFHLAFALGFVPLLGVVLAAIGLAVARRDPAAAGWKRPLVAVLIFDAVVWPAFACVWLFGEPLVMPAVDIEDGLRASRWDLCRQAALPGLSLVLLIGLSLYFRKRSRQAVLAVRWLLLLLLVKEATGAVLPLISSGVFDCVDADVFALYWRTLPLVVVAALALRWMRRRFGEREPATSRLSRGAGLGLGTIYCFGGLIRYTALSWMVKILLPPDRVIAAPLVDDPGTSSVWVILAMAPAMLAIVPWAEEVLYRGVLFPGLRSRLVTWRAGLLSAVAFALSHQLVGINLVYFVWIGLVLAWARERTGGLFAPIAIHILINLYVISRQILFS